MISMVLPLMVLMMGRRGSPVGVVIAKRIAGVIEVRGVWLTRLRIGVILMMSKVLGRRRRVVAVGEMTAAIARVHVVGVHCVLYRPATVKNSNVKDADV